NTLMHDELRFKTILPFVKNLDHEHQIAFFSIRNIKGEPLLSRPDIIDEAIEILNTLPDNILSQLFSIQDNEGNTLLHETVIFNKSDSLFGRLQPEVFQIRNKDGFTVEEWSKINLSLKWLVKDKAVINTKALSEEEYAETAQQLTQNLNHLWGTFVFGDEQGNVPKEYLTLKVLGDNKIFTPEEIKNALDGMLDKIIKKTPWLGTPPENDSNGLHQFYSQMLHNFEQVVLYGIKDDPPSAQAAGSLISIAKTELEGRCAAAYQAEIEQAKMLLDSDGQELGMEENFDKLARASLTNSIENIVRSKYHGDSHAFTQMLYSIGMAISPDPLSQITIEKSQEEIVAEWTKDKCVSDLKGMIGRLGNEQLQDWFKLSTPDDYRKEIFLSKQEAVKKTEQEIVLESRNSLKQRGLPDSLIDAVLTLFQSTQGVSLVLNLRPRRFVSEAVFQKLNQATTPEEVEEAKTLFSEDNNSDTVKRRELSKQIDQLRDKDALEDDENKLLASLSKERSSLQQKSIGIQGEFNDLKLNAERRIALSMLLKTKNLQLSSDELATIVAEKKTFDDKISNMAEEMEIDFSPSETGLPSRALEYARRVEYTIQFFIEEIEGMKLNKRGTVEILKRIGVLESAEFRG
ncbi:MAG TPA: hypothetical protein VGP47_09490, partial [Parachlamydiaceae bacterium]|nr:hypothetical protein [Parachlamydiaceae bacterium]